MTSGSKKIIVIAGPTAVGKTALSIEVAKRLGTSIVSADSRQCYQGMAIGTAQPSPDEMEQVRHYFIDAFPVTTSLTAADYEELALSYLSEIFKTSDTAVICGGTGLYIKALCEGLDEMPEIDNNIATAVNDAYQNLGREWLTRALENEDPVFASRGEMQNPARMIRALIFKRSVGKSLLEFHTTARKQRPFDIIKVALDLPRAVLYDRINERVIQMLDRGLLQEVEQLYSLRYLKNLQTVGYTELFDYLSGKHSIRQAISLIQQHSRNYAKRQLTWFRKDPEYIWLNPFDESSVKKIVQIASE